MCYDMVLFSGGAEPCKGIRKRERVRAVNLQKDDQNPWKGTEGHFCRPRPLSRPFNIHFCALPFIPIQMFNNMQVAVNFLSDCSTSSPFISLFLSYIFFWQRKLNAYQR